MTVVQLRNGSFMASQDGVGFVQPSRTAAIHMLAQYIIASKQFARNKMDRPDEINYINNTFRQPTKDAALLEAAKKVISTKDELNRIGMQPYDDSLDVDKRATSMLAYDKAQKAHIDAKRHYHRLLND